MAITYGYVRVSTADQNEARQIDAMKLVGVCPENLVIDKQSGKDFNRPGWKRLKRKIRGGDLLVVQSVDRMGRNYAEIIEEWRSIVSGKGADIRVLDMPLRDTTNNIDGLDRKVRSRYRLADNGVHCRYRTQKHQGTTTARNRSRKIARH